MLTKKIILSLAASFVLCAGAYAVEATAFALKANGKAVLTTGDSTVNITPGQEIAAGTLVEVQSGKLGVKLPDGTSVYFNAGTVFRISYAGPTAEITLLSGAVSGSFHPDTVVIITAAGVVHSGESAMVVSYAPDTAGGAVGVLTVSTTGGPASVVTGTSTVTVPAGQQLSTSPTGAPTTTALSPAQTAAVNNSTQGNGAAPATPATPADTAGLGAATPAAPATPATPNIFDKDGKPLSPNGEGNTN